MKRAGGSPPPSPQSMSDRGNDHLDAARRLAGANGLFVADVTQDKVVDGKTTYVRAYVVYRRGAEIKDASGKVIGREKGTRLGRREDPAALLAFVKKLVGPVTV